MHDVGGVANNIFGLQMKQHISTMKISYNQLPQYVDT